MCILTCEMYREKYWPLVAKIVGNVPGHPELIRVLWYEAKINIEDNYKAEFVGKLLHFFTVTL